MKLRKLVKRQGITNLALVPAVLIILSASTGWSQISIPLINPGFQSSSDGNSGFANVDGWFNTGSTYTDSGITSANFFQNNTPPLAFVKAGDDGAVQLTQYFMVNADQITLTWDAVNVFGATDQAVFLFSLSPDGQSFAFLNGNQSLVTDTESQYSLSYTVTPADQGNIIGIGFGAGSTGYVGYDNFSLQVTPAPEPATVGILAIGAFGAVLTYRRKSA
jgi:hypothetical protein